MKAVSHYSRADDRSASYSFIEILKIDTSYSLDPSTNSPKIISFFDEIKEEYLSSIREMKDPPTIIKYDTVYVPVNVRDIQSEYILKQALIRSVFLPGSGHLYKEGNLKSWILTSLSVASISAGVYYIIDSNKKEKLYLEETDRDKIPDKYREYNSSYRMRNFAFISFAALWLYSQLDLLFFLDSEAKDDLSFIKGVLYINRSEVSINYLVHF
jgi:hypothetical protein